MINLGVFKVAQTSVFLGALWAFEHLVLTAALELTFLAANTDRVILRGWLDEYDSNGDGKYPPDDHHKY